MVENAWSPAQYSEVYQSIQLFVSGIGTRSFGQDHKIDSRRSEEWLVFLLRLWLMMWMFLQGACNCRSYCSKSGYQKLSVLWNKDEISVVNLTDDKDMQKQWRRFKNDKYWENGKLFTMHLTIKITTSIWRFCYRWDKAIIMFILIRGVRWTSRYKIWA
jgi:hypothetical protein